MHKARQLRLFDEATRILKTISQAQALIARLLTSGVENGRWADARSIPDFAPGLLETEYGNHTTPRGG